MLNKWDQRFLNLAAEVSTWSKDPSTKVGAVIVRPDKTIVSLGYNGFARGVHDLPARLEDREQRLLYMTHAEMNAILTASSPLKGCTLYVSPLSPCAFCASAIIQVGISRIVAPKTVPERWAVNFQAASKMFAEAGVAAYSVDRA